MKLSFQIPLRYLAYATTNHEHCCCKGIETRDHEDINIIYSNIQKIISFKCVHVKTLDTVSKFISWETIKSYDT